MQTNSQLQLCEMRYNY